MANSSTQVSTIEQKVEELVTETITLKLNVKEDFESLENLEIEELLNLANKAKDDGNKELLGAICQKLLEWINDKKLDFESIELSHLLNIVVIAHAADDKELQDVSCQAMADRIKDKEPEEIRKIFNIENDFTPEEEAKIREENAWAFED